MRPAGVDVPPLVPPARRCCAGGPAALARPGLLHPAPQPLVVGPALRSVRCLGLATLKSGLFVSPPVSRPVLGGAREFFFFLSLSFPSFPAAPLSALARRPAALHPSFGGNHGGLFPDRPSHAPAAGFGGFSPDSAEVVRGFRVAWGRGPRPSVSAPGPGRGRSQDRGASGRAALSGA